MTGGASKKLAILLVVSLGFNLFMVGVFASRWFFPEPNTGSGEEPHIAEGRGGLFMMKGFLNTTNKSSRKEVEKVWDKQGDNLKNAVMEMHKARQEVKKLLSSETPNQATLRTAFTTLQKRTAASQAAMHDIMIETALRLTPEQRQTMFGHDRQHRHGPGGRRGSGDRGVLRGSQ